MSSAGHWKIEVSEPHPAWVTITYAGGWGDDPTIRHIHHRDLRDLQYAVERAIKEARDKLPDSHKHEMD